MLGQRLVSPFLFCSRLAFEMKLLQSGKPMHLIAFRRELVYFYSTIAKDSLYRRISPLGGNISVIPVLDQWVLEGRPVCRDELRNMIKELRAFSRFKQALEISIWMTDKRYLPLSSDDVVARMNLILRVHGLELVENYFNIIPSQLKGFRVHIALLNCYAHEKCVDKANAILQKINEMGSLRTPVSYNIMMNLYYQIGEFEKLDPLLQEMKEKGVSFDRFTYSIRLSAYAAAADITGVDKIVEQMESDTNVVLDWNCYAIAANGYLNAGLIDKFVSMLRKSEGLLATAKRRGHPFDALLKLYAKSGKKDEVHRVWNLYKKGKVYNKGFISMIRSLLILDDIEGAERIFKERETQKLSDDLRIPNMLVEAYCREGLMEKAEDFINETLTVRGKFSVESWCYLANGYLQKDQLPQAVDALKKAASLCPPELNHLKEILATFLHGKQDVKEAEKVVNLLRAEAKVSFCSVFD